MTSGAHAVRSGSSRSLSLHSSSSAGAAVHRGASGLPFALGRKTTKPALTLVPVRGWGLNRPLHTALSRCALVAAICTRVTSGGTVARLVGSAKKSTIPQRCREAFAPHLARHHCMPCCWERDNRGLPKAGCHLIVSDLALPRGVAVLLNSTIHPQRSIAFRGIKHLRWYLIPRVVLQQPCHRIQQEVLPPRRRGVARPTVPQWHGVALLPGLRLVLPVAQRQLVLRGPACQRGISRPNAPEGVRGQGVHGATEQRGEEVLGDANRLWRGPPTPQATARPNPSQT